MRALLKKVPNKLWAILIAVVALKVSMDIAYPSGAWRYKTTIAIETPEGIKTGSAVREVSTSSSIIQLPEEHSPIGVKGEAVVVDLGSRGVVFALLSGYSLGSDYGSVVPFYVFPYKRGGKTPAGIRYYTGLKAGPVELSPQWYPQFVRFRDLNDPKTVENLMAVSDCFVKDDMAIGGCAKRGWHVSQDHFEEAFGAGVKLQSVTIEMTEEKVTWSDITKILPWFESQRNIRGYFGGDSNPPFNDPTKTYLTPMSFITGEHK